MNEIQHSQYRVTYVVNENKLIISIYVEILLKKIISVFYNNLNNHNTPTNTYFISCSAVLNKNRGSVRNTCTFTNTQRFNSCIIWVARCSLDETTLRLL